MKLWIGIRRPSWQTCLKVLNFRRQKRKYGITYDVEVAAGLVKKAESEKPYARDSGLNRANRERVEESERQDPYSSRERITGASSRDVSPNTPEGEDV